MKVECFPMVLGVAGMQHPLFLGGGLVASPMLVTSVVSLGYCQCSTAVCMVALEAQHVESVECSEWNSGMAFFFFSLGGIEQLTISLC